MFVRSGWTLAMCLLVGVGTAWGHAEKPSLGYSYLELMTGEVTSGLIVKPGGLRIRFDAGDIAAPFTEDKQSIAWSREMPVGKTPANVVMTREGTLSATLRFGRRSWRFAADVRTQPDADEFLAVVTAFCAGEIR